MFRNILRMRMLSPAHIGGMITHLPKFVRVFYRLMKDHRVSVFVKAAPFLILLLMFTPPAIELDFVPGWARSIGCSQSISRSNYSYGYARPTSCANTSARLRAVNNLKMRPR